MWWELKGNTSHVPWVRSGGGGTLLQGRPIIISLLNYLLEICMFINVITPLKAYFNIVLS